MKASTQTSWRTWRLGELLKYEQPGRYLVRSTEYSEQGKYPVLTAGKTFVLGYTNEPNGAYTNHPVIIFDDFTTASKYVDFDFKAKSSAMKMLTARAGVADLRFVYERMQLIKYPIFDHKRRWIAEFSKLEIEAPELVEQTAIAEVAHDLADHIATLERLIAKKHAIKQGMMQQLLTGRTRLPGFTDSWRRVMLGELGAFSKGRGVKRDDVRSSGVPCIRYGELYTDFVNYTSSTRSFVSPDVAATALPIRSGDLLFAGSGETRDEIGMCVAYVGDAAAVAGGDIVVLRGSGAFNAVFLAALTNLPSVARQKSRAGQGDAVVHISSRALGDITVEIPSRAEQDAIAEVIVDADRELAALSARLQKARDIKAGMMQQLLTGRVRLPVEAAV